MTLDFSICYDKSRLQSILTDKSSGITPEAQKKVDELVKRIEDLLSNSNGACDIPDEVIKEIARCLVPDIIAFFETEEAKREFEAWKLEQEKKEEKTKNEEMVLAISTTSVVIVNNIPSGKQVREFQRS